MHELQKQLISKCFRLNIDYFQQILGFILFRPWNNYFHLMKYRVFHV